MVSHFSAKPYVLVAEAGVALGALAFALHHRVESNEARRQDLGDFADDAGSVCARDGRWVRVFTAAFATTWILWSDDGSPSEQAHAHNTTARTHTSTSP